MGKRRKAIKVKGDLKESQKPLPTVFNCLFCNHERSVIIKLDKKTSIGSLHCNVCAQEYSTSINCSSTHPAVTLLHAHLANRAALHSSLDLSGAVDVYADWVDAADEVKKEQRRIAKRYGGGSSSGAPGGSRGEVADHRRETNIVEDDEDDIDEELDD
ncbi:hypothetical protein ABW20_dc0103096 [Dactylellina cionopaga]|nr:hypothetical protein ABW20_dc0103096 [Dactylellina cionopaga]